MINHITIIIIPSVLSRLLNFSDFSTSYTSHGNNHSFHPFSPCNYIMCIVTVYNVIVFNLYAHGLKFSISITHIQRVPEFADSVIVRPSINLIK